MEAVQCSTEHDNICTCINLCFVNSIHSHHSINFFCIFQIHQTTSLKKQYHRYYVLKLKKVTQMDKHCHKEATQQMSQLSWPLMKRHQMKTTSTNFVVDHQMKPPQSISPRPSTSLVYNSSSSSSSCCAWRQKVMLKIFSLILQGVIEVGKFIVSKQSMQLFLDKCSCI